ncbi:MAG: hypothetical protein P4L53_18160 [Candidatus Obscuribacterales bacterium]|nr:hypothetical protein [Candidatus Obscuribacterales bacterium]
MSYLILALAMNFMVSFLAFVFLVQLNAPADNAYRVVWGSLAYLAIVSVLAYLTTGWSSAYAGIVGGLLSFAVLRPGDVLFTWGRAVIRFANTKLIRSVTPLNEVLRFIGVRLQNAQVPFNNRFRRR